MAGGGDVESAARCISLVTDYGAAGGFVGALHAVAFALAPQARVLDLDHSVPPGDVRLGALRLERLVPLLPGGVHVGVVDPGVGGSRRGIAVRAGEHVLVGPDNGLLLWAAEVLGGVDEAAVLDDDRFLRRGPARTFDGRDVFMPAACHLWLGTAVAAIGSPADPTGLVRLERPVAVARPDGALEVEVLQVDGFGNVQFAAGPSELAGLGTQPGQQMRLRSDGVKAGATIGYTFSDVAPGHGVLLLDSDGQLAFSINQGRADEVLAVRPGSIVTLIAVPQATAGGETR
jgi:S-adenosylmethionine hydrolase